MQEAAHHTWPRILQEIQADEERECVFFEGLPWESLPAPEREGRMLSLARGAWIGGKVLVVLWSDDTYTKCSRPMIH